MEPLRWVLVLWIAAIGTASAQPYVVHTIAGKGKVDYAGDGKAATSVNLFSPNRVAFDAAGNLYFTEGYYHRVFKVSAAGTLTAVAGNGDNVFDGEGGLATAAALPYPEGIAVDAAGNLYVGTSARLCKIIGGRLRTIAGNGTGGYSGDHGAARDAEIHTPTGIVLDGQGNVFFSDSQSSVVRRIGTDGIITTVAGTGTPGYSGEGLATSAQLSTPEGLALDSKGNLYIADRYNNRVRRVAPGGIITTFAGTGEPGTGGTSNDATKSKLFQPEGVAVDSNDNVYIADASNSLLKMVEPSGVIHTFSLPITSLNDVAVSPAGWVAAPDFLQSVINRIMWGDSGSVSVVAGIVRTSALGDHGPATSAFLVEPWGLAADPAGDWYIADSGDQRLRRIAVDQTINTVAGTGVFGSSVDGSAATASNIAQPRALAADSAGNIYFNSACQIRELLKDGGTLKTVAGGFICAYRGDPGNALDAQFQFPRGLAIDSSGTMYIADTDNNRIRRLNLNTAVVTTIAGTGQRGYAGNGTSAVQANLDTPLGIAADAKGNLYFADQYNHRIRKITAAGIIADFAGTGTCDTASDGPALSSPLCYPSGVALDATGNVYIADSGYIRRVTVDGRLTTIAGDGWYGMGGEGEPALSTAIDPFYVALDAKGRVCFSDSTNIRIRCLDAAPAPPPSPVTITGVLNNASGATGIASGSWVSIYGTNLSATTRDWTGDISGNTLPTKLNGVSVTINGKSAAVYYISPGQLNVQAPGDSATGPVPVVVTNTLGAATATANLVPYAPGFFAIQGKYPAAVHTDGVYVAPAGYFGSSAASRPAAPGEVVLLFGTGFGPTTSPVAAGQIFNGAAPLADPTQLQMTIGGVVATVQFAGMVAAGEYQFNVVIPPVADGDQAIVATMAGFPTQSGLSISVKN
jgi:uncharacterized protein (TIGR03437 family)